MGLLSAAVLLAAAGALPGVSAGSGNAPPLDPGEDSAAAALRARGASWGQVPDLQAALLALGPDALPDLLDLWLRGEIPQEADQAALRLEPPRALALELALEQHPRERVRALLDRFAESSPDEPSRTRALALLERLGSAADYERAARLAASGGGSCGPAVRAAYQSAVARILAREPGSLGELARELRDLPACLVDETAESIGALGTRQAFASLAAALETRPDASAVLLAQLRRLGSRRASPPPPSALGPIRACLHGPDEAGVALAAMLVRELDDTGAIPDLIAALESTDRAARAAALAALRALARVDLGPQPDLWRTWFEQQQRWSAGNVGRNARAVRCGTPTQAVLGIRGLASRVALRDEVTLYLLPGLERRESAVAELACSALASLGSWSAIPELLRALDRPEPTVREAARAALAAITHLDLSADAAAWRRRLAILER